MLGSNASGLDFLSTQEKILEWGNRKVKNLEADWAEEDDYDYPGKASAETDVKLKDKVISLSITMKGQKMWTMEFGRGHNDQTGEGVSRKVINSPAFKNLTRLPSFNRKGRMRSYYGRFKAAQRRKAKDKNNVTYTPQSFEKGMGGRAFNIVRIYTRQGTYRDLDGVQHEGSGIGGEYGLNTEAFTYHKKGYYQKESLARDGQGIIQSTFGIENLEQLQNATWILNGSNESQLLEAISNGIKKDVSNFLKGLNK